MASEPTIKPGVKFGNLTVLRLATPEEEKPLKFKRRQFVCQCTCGRTTVKVDRSLTRWSGVDYSKAKFRGRADWFKPLSCNACRRAK